MKQIFRGRIAASAAVILLAGCLLLGVLRSRLPHRDAGANSWRFPA